MSLNDILQGKQFAEPPEAAIIKRFLAEKFQASAAVSFRPNQIIITVASSALAGSLRLYLHELKALCQTDKRLVIRIGH